MAPALLKNLNIRTRLLLLCLAVATPLLSMCALVIWKEYQGLSQIAHRATSFHDAVAVRAVRQWVKTQQDELKAISLLPSIQSGNYYFSQQIFQSKARTTADINCLAQLDRHGNLLVSNLSGLRPANSLTTLPLFQSALAGKQTLSDYTICPLSGKPALLFLQPVTNKGKVVSVLVQSFKPAVILQLFSGLQQEDGFVIVVVDGNKKVIARTLENKRWAGKDYSQAKTVLAAAKKSKGTIEVIGIADGIQRTYAFDRVPGTNWLVSVGIPTQAIYGSAHERLGILILCTVLALGSSILLAYAFTGHFTGPIHQLVREAVSIGRGDLSKRVAMLHGGELGLLSRAFNQMAMNLELHREHKLMVENISESVRQSLDITAILNTAVFELGRALAASRCCLALLDQDPSPTGNNNQLEFNYVWFNRDRGGSALKNRSIYMAPGSILKVILEQGAILSMDLTDNQTLAPLLSNQSQAADSTCSANGATTQDSSADSAEDWRSIKSLIACPIVFKQQPIGMILVHQCDQVRAWNELELELVEAVARHVALALDHASLFARTRRMAEQEFLINQIVRATRTSLDGDNILNTVTQELGKALGADYCQILQPSPQAPLVVTHEYHINSLKSHNGLSLYGTVLDFHPAADNPQELRSVLGIDLAALKNLSGNEFGDGLREAPIAVIADVATDRRTAKFHEFLGIIGSKSLIAAPLLRDDRVLGILLVHQCQQVRDWQDGDVRLVAAVADQLAVAVSHAQLFEQVKHQSITDGLTGLYNHIYFKNRLAEELNRAQRKNTACSLLMLDLDKLKQINDTYGHPVGDAAIRHVAAVLKSLIRSGDTAARYGGEEFGVILPETPLSEAVQIADRLRHSINRNPVPALGHISTSIGVATFPEQAKDLAELIEKADKALYVAKNRGRNCVCVWHDACPQLVISEETSVVL